MTRKEILREIEKLELVLEALRGLRRGRILANVRASQRARLARCYAEAGRYAIT